MSDKRSNPMEKNINRREFLKLTAVGVAVAAGTHAVTSTKASSEAPKGKHQWAMIIDQSKCEGCNYCTLACQAHNDVNPDIQWNKVIVDRMVGDRQVYVPRPCMHCEKAPCVEVCPVKASYYRDDGIVMMDYNRCIGCRYCQVACPYEAALVQLGKIHWRKPRGAGMGHPRGGATSTRSPGKMFLLLPNDRPRTQPGTQAWHRPGCDSRLCERLPNRGAHLRRPERS